MARPASRTNSSGFTAHILSSSSLNPYSWARRSRMDGDGCSAVAERPARRAVRRHHLGTTRGRRRFHPAARKFLLVCWQGAAGVLGVVQLARRTASDLRRQPRKADRSGLLICHPPSGATRSIGLQATSLCRTAFQIVDVRHDPPRL
jgi:hypothetical protein